MVCVGSWNVDFLVRVPRPIERGETLQGRGFQVLPGGKGSNAAIACARQGARVVLFARVGDDDYGRMALDLWKRESIDTRHVQVAKGEPSGAAQILVYDDGDNSIAVAPGANAGLRVEELPQTRIVLSNCEVPLAATQAAFQLARKAGATTILNPSPVRQLPDELLALCDVLVVNEVERKSIPREFRGALVVTRGATGCALFRSGTPALELPGHAVKVVDTVGAGDTFAGALAAALARGEALERAMAWANAAAALSVTGQGAIGGMPPLRAVETMLNG